MSQLEVAYLFLWCDYLCDVLLPESSNVFALLCLPFVTLENVEGEIYLNG